MPETRGFEEEEALLEEAREPFITEIAKNIHLYNITSSAGRVYGNVFFSTSPMTLDDMSESVGMSKTSMSTCIRQLSEAHMVERVWEKGVRKDLYKTEDDWYKSFTEVFIDRWRHAVISNREAIAATKKRLEDLRNDAHYSETIKKVEHDLEKLRDAEEFYSWLNDVITLFETGAIHDIVPAEKEKPNKSGS
ncbi:GbsR/MarR family transcriptional regulator [Salisediminibacterium halotolerans]|uniref:HTH-type transcriptional regulator n=1 Tax=Salisediminibacterium halotolerans TaxID=517425 RepID=A0A1H9SN73_9BACI|nr:GbsR/MarR family transcriptional regulator [Salisediminibacterium haloalkalitolerans]SER86328.1 DNA-binding transcriptional regulator GbsR, MarR family [Salisediminibacterium haloalkalitolerans]